MVKACPLGVAVHGLAELRVVLPDVGKEIARQRYIAGGHAVVRRPLEHGQMLGGLGNDRRRLDTGRARPDQTNPFAGEIHALVWPLPGVHPAPGEGLQSRDVRYVGGGKAADGGDQILRHEVAAVGRRHRQWFAVSS